MDHDKTCVFSSLTSNTGPDSENAYIIKKRDCSSEPASRSTYIAVQKGDTDIPFSGLQKPAPQPRAHKGAFLLFHLLLLNTCPSDCTCDIISIKMNETARKIGAIFLFN